MRERAEGGPFEREDAPEAVTVCDLYRSKSEIRVLSICARWWLEKDTGVPPCSEDDADVADPREASDLMRLMVPLTGCLLAYPAMTPAVVGT